MLLEDNLYHLLLLLILNRFNTFFIIFVWFQVCNVELKDLKACVKLVLPMQCEAKGCEITEEAMKTLLEVTQYKVPLQELQVVYEETGDFDETALALEHLRWDCTWSMLCLIYWNINL